MKRIFISSLLLLLVSVPTFAGTKHKVVFTDGVRTISQQEVEDGEDAVPPTPKTSGSEHFSGWDGDYKNITKDTELKAVYDNPNDNMAEYNNNAESKAHENSKSLGKSLSKENNESSDTEEDTTDIAKEETKGVDSDNTTIAVDKGVKNVHGDIKVEHPKDEIDNIKSNKSIFSSVKFCAICLCCVALTIVLIVVAIKFA